MDNFERVLVYGGILTLMVVSIICMALTFSRYTTVNVNQMRIDSLTNEIEKIKYHIDHEQSDTIVVNNDIIIKFIEKK